MKKLLSSVLAAIMLLQCAVFADGSKTSVFTENFSGYTDGYTADTIGTFKPRKTAEALKITASDGKNFLNVPSTKTESTPKQWPAAVYDGTLPNSAAGEIDVTLKKEDGIINGVRFYMHNSNKNYYELSFLSGKAWQIVKAVSNERTVLTESEIADELNEGLYDLEIMYSVDTVKWRIKDGDGNALAGTEDIGTDWHAYSIDSPFAEATGLTFALVGGGSETTGSLYTNVKAYTLSEISDGTDWVFKFSDDFSTYTNDGETAAEIGVWKSNGKSGVIATLGTKLLIDSKSIGGKTKAVMSVPSTALYSEPTNFTTAVLDKEIPAGGKQEIKVSFKSDGELVTGIRFMVHNGGSNYYEFQKNRGGNDNPQWALIKCVNGARSVLVGGVPGGMGGEFTLSITYDYSDYTGVIDYELTRLDGTLTTPVKGKAEDLNPFKYIGTCGTELVSGAQNLKYSYFTDFSIKATASHEEAPLDENDPTSVATYLTRQNNIISAYNTAVANNSKADMVSFLTGNAKYALSRMDRINIPALATMSDTEVESLAERLITYGDTVTFSSFADITEFENRILQEIIIGNLCNQTDDGVMAEYFGNNAVALGITLDEYYTTMTNDVIALLLNRTYLNVADFTNAFNESLIMANYNYTINGEYFLKLMEKHSAIIGYNTTHFETVDKTAAANAILMPNVKASINNLTAMAAWIDAYNTSPTPTPTPTPTPVPSVSTGGGGGGGGSFAKIPNPTPVPEKAEDAPIAAAAPLYSDVADSHWAYEAIRFLNARKAAAGYEDGSFVPEGKITRAEFIKMLTVLYNVTLPEDIAEGEEIEFFDVTEDAWYYDSMMAAAYAGILSGDGGYAYPNREITRQEIAVLIDKAMKYIGFEINSDTELSRFNDDDEIDRWAFAAVKRLQTGGVINGSNGCFAPKDNAKRCEAAQMLYKSVNVSERSEPTDEIVE